MRRENSGRKSKRREKWRRRGKRDRKKRGSKGRKRRMNAERKHLSVVSAKSGMVLIYLVYLIPKLLIPVNSIPFQYH
jgi:hypothetical protein